jgi:hypothetical protein
MNIHISIYFQKICSSVSSHGPALQIYNNVNQCLHNRSQGNKSNMN